MANRNYISFPFSIDPWTHGVCDEWKQIQESVFLILSTHVKERIMLPTFGSCLKNYVFELQQDETKEMIQREVIASLTLWEPRIQHIQLSFQLQDAVLNVIVSYVCQCDGRTGEVRYTLHE